MKTAQDYLDACNAVSPPRWTLKMRLRNTPSGEASFYRCARTLVTSPKAAHNQGRTPRAARHESNSAPIEQRKRMYNPIFKRRGNFI